MNFQSVLIVNQLMTLMYSKMHFYRQGHIVIYIYLQRINRISPARFGFLLYLFYLFTFTRAHLVEDNCRAKRFCLRKD